jgi:AmiR/NasT family two-component response regulator
MPAKTGNHKQAPKGDGQKLEADMSRPLRIAIADDEIAVQDFYAEILQALGHEVVCRASSGGELLAGCRRVLPDLVISESRMRDMSASEAACQLAQTRPTPWIVVAAGADEPSATAGQGAQEDIVGYIHKPLRQSELGETIPQSMARFDAARKRASAEADRLRQSMQEHRIVERAKAIVMRNRSFEQDEALRWLQEFAADRGLSLADAAKKVTLQPARESAQ